ncbi:HNH endonuclease [Vibrio tubiashii]|uniref:HNH endonuclease n=1 Tax=Vibrio tubiashii TaxID=29498 RepID=UPI001EFD826B|nr:HNH endonuclease [Vibrio tubiashii]MCG9581068.1 HNH endonuclease [Vibrio tubiashii]MCG9614659.1 HNH endonuclease [Vibrio tubiashii]MCG9687290.1 HNH endonuclease [Vibrio tubiashii]
MKINVDFSALFSAVMKMGVTDFREFEPTALSDEREQIDIKLGDGIEVSSDEIDFDNGFLSYEGRQILLYIKDHGGRIGKALLNPEKSGNRYHVADCRTLKSMRKEGRFERYVVTNRTDGRFPIAGKDYQSQALMEGEAGLKVCKCCLKELNYKGYASGLNRTEIFASFSMAEFFKTYSSFFTNTPSRQATSALSDYTRDWASVSTNYRSSKKYTCEQCNVDLSSAPSLLHTHHINGVKDDNREQNLKALCFDCHSKQIYHDHLCPKHNERKQVNDLRRAQGLLSGIRNWEQVLELADPGVSGAIHLCQRLRWPLPEIHHQCEGGTTLELAWPSNKFGLVIDMNDCELVKNSGWKAYTVTEFLNANRS